MKWLLIAIITIIVLFGICKIGYNTKPLAKPMFFPTNNGGTIMVMIP